MVGGEIWWCSASTVKTDSMPPAPPSRWPVIDLVELTTSFFAWSPKEFLIALVSFRSPSGVEVLPLVRLAAGIGQARLHRAARAVDVGRGHVEGVAAHAEADHLGVDPG